MEDGTITCPKCERSVDDSLTWCPYCGTELRPTATADRPSRRIAAELEEPGIGIAPEDPVVPATRVTRRADAAAGTRKAARLPMIVGLAVLLIGGAAVWFFLMDDERGSVSLADITAGVCWNDPEVGEVDTGLLDVPRVPCSEPHANEVFAVVDLPGGTSAAYPEAAELELLAFRACWERFEEYVGAPFPESPLDIYTLYPTLSSWAEGDREVVCSVYLLDGSNLVGSTRGTAERTMIAADDPSDAADCTALADRTIALAQRFIDFFDSVPPEEMDAIFEGTPPEMVPLIKTESLLLGRAAELGCNLDDLNALVAGRSGALTASSEFGQFIIDEVVATGFFATD